MILVFSLAVAVLFGSGAFLMLKRDLIRVVAGVILISNSVNLFIMSAGLSRGRAPIYPLPEHDVISDPVVQSMVLTAIVISFGLTALLLSLVYRVYTAYRPADEEENVLRDEDAAEPAVEREEVVR